MRDRTPTTATSPIEADPTGQAEFETLRADTRADEGKRLRNGIVSLVILVVLVGALLLAVPGLRDVADKISDVAPGWVGLAIVLEILSCVGYTLAFCGIFYRVPTLLAVRTALSQMAFGAVLPVGGAGGIAIGAWVTKAKGGSLRRFIERSAVLFLLTSGVNAATLALAGILVGVGLLHAPHSIVLGLVPGLVACVGIGIFWVVPAAAHRFALVEDAGRIVRWIHTTARVVQDAKEEVRHPSWRVMGGSVAYLWCDIAMLWVAFRAFGHAPPVGALTLAFIIGYLGNIIPVPGGIGALDGGLTAALVLYGADPTSSAAAVLVYHAIVLWVPTLLGTIAFLRLRRTLDEPLVLKPERRT
ncbi:MAG TPA: lysylphosphatidylglycerol synthase transmembrane domain-containing protein [Baekduia sp.]|uniref:lysylphosphatidylglycerol synthase transmembrane domain-containing protein n=1 Tax=Baekduia sp. TaxID=2600305 RepID=UPI002D78A73D|nr:lysylphosphatidylglycerol synthase transmembrane domain-containing protein [Baekduia sp.]HET6506479.1 lysylphosphatidylglycerol synthase transmembrane domain-containing protein [Baekduia sp.]